MKIKNKKIVLFGAGLLLIATSAMAYGGQRSGNGGGCHGDSVCMAERQAEAKAQNLNLNIEDMQKERQNQGYGQGKGYDYSKNQLQDNKKRGQVSQNFKIDDGTCNELEDIKNSPKYDLSKDEKDYISHMREEEKIARDVYIKLYEKWGIRTFGNIKDAEQRHMDSVKVLIDKYGLEDSMKSNIVGEFNNPEFQKLYNDLIEKGYKSEIDALQVGMTIEDVDIYDLEKFMSQSENKDLKIVFNNLNTGSFNHMKAFKRQLDIRNGTYEPQFITIDRMNNILKSENTHNHNQDNNVSNKRNNFRVQKKTDIDTTTSKGMLEGFFNWFSFLKFW